MQNSTADENDNQDYYIKMQEGRRNGGSKRKEKGQDHQIVSMGQLRPLKITPRHAALLLSKLLLSSRTTTIGFSRVYKTLCNSLRWWFMFVAWNTIDIKLSQ